MLSEVLPALDDRSSGYLDDQLRKEKQYWLEKLSGELQPAGLPLDRPRPAVWSGRTDVVHFVAEPETAARLREICGGNDALAFTAIVAALKICLRLYSGVDDVCVGTAIHERYTELASLNKFLVLRDRVEGAMTARQLLSSVKRTLSEAYAHQKYPFDKLSQILNTEPLANRCQFFDVVALFDRLNNRENCDHLKNDVTLMFSWRGRDLACDIEYRPALFDRANIETFSDHFRAALRAILWQPDKQIGQIELLSPERRERILVGFNKTQREYNRLAAIHQLFERQARRVPDAIAVVHGQQRLTYQQLNDNANQLAHRLRRFGVMPGQRVGICLHHSPAMLTAILAVLKAGGAYVPFDPAHPAAGIAAMMADAQPALLLTESVLAGKFAASETPVLLLDVEASAIAQEEVRDLPREVTGEDLAYIIYTSGSTGEPKGVMIRHNSLVNYICWASEVYLKGRSLDFALYSSLAFDLTVTSVYTPLVTGNAVRIYSPENRVMALPEILEDGQAGVLKLTPSHLSLIKERDNRGSGIRTLIVGGEALETALAKRIQESFGEEVEIFNEYGPTEATVGCMIYKFDAATDRREFVPIGEPAANTQIYVLDQTLSPAAENVIGELYVSGDGLAQGYLNKEDLTKERFIDHPFLAGRKMYKTGDRARRLPNGAIEYLGRNDEQVKYHGHRVELNHIRSVLNRHAQVRDSAVVVVKDRDEYDVMLAYYVSRHELETDELRRFLSEHIVEETIPSVFVHLKRLPLTLNGKVNLRALPTLEQVRKNMKRAIVAPQTRIERELANIWAQILVLDRVGVHDNFFALGGHSLLATQLISRIKSNLNVDLPLRSLFETPTIAGLAETIERADSTGTLPQAPPLVAVSRERSLPLSFAQQRLWFLDQLQPGNRFYNVPAAMRLSGSLNLPALEQTLGELISRHEVLRTNFPTVDGVPVQRINPAQPFRIPVVDLRAHSEEARRIEVSRIIEEESQRPFDLKDDLLLRVILLRLGDEEQIVFFMLHHIVGDAWSMEIMIREVSALYQAFLQDKPSPLPALPIQYADFAVWQREWLSGDVLDQELAYWRNELAGVPPVLELPLDHVRPPVQKFEGASISYEIEGRVAGKLKELSLREGSTLFMTMLAAFKALIYRTTNQRDVLVGAPVAGRNTLETENLIGFFTNTLALRTRVAPENSFLNLLRQVRDVTLRAYAHQDLPFEKLVEELNPERSLSHTPLLQIVFGFYNNEGQTLEMPGVKLSPVNTKSKTAKFDLIHNVVESSGKINGSILYNTDLFERETIERLIGQYKLLLQSAIENPQQSVERLALLTEGEKQQLLSGWNNTRKEFPQWECAHHAFERQAAQTPEAVAVAAEGEQVNYGELNRRANRLAHYLQAMGVGPEVQVCILLSRSIDLVVGALAVLKAGGAYVPLDPATPLQRLSFYLEDSQAPLLITQSLLADTLPAYWGQTILLDEDQEKFDGYSSDNPVSKVVSDNLAYTVYTSGSTGQPKGVQIQHGTLLNLIHWHNNSYNVGPMDRATLLANPAFDASVWELWPYLTIGASVYIPSEEVKLNVTRLIEWLSRNAITISFLPTPLAEIVIDQVWPSGVSLRALLTGGDKLRQGPQQALPFDLINHYGPSENTVVSTSVRVDTVGRSETAPPIGKPIDNTEAYVFDSRLQPVPIGVAGEIYIGGSGLARGYLGRPDLTAERFLPHPFSKTPGARLYRTGDLARRLPDGNIEFLGRLDHQIKLRGFRIELGEIEAALAQDPAITQCAVILRQDPPFDGRLAAYVAIDPEADCTAASLRERLKQRLPDYMIPASFLFLPALPLTANGKLDRNALAAIEGAGSETDVAEERQMNWLESRLAALWCEVLGIKNIGPRDNFFDAGGDSVKAAIIINRLQQQLRRIIHVVTIFDTPSIEQYAAYLEEHYRDAVLEWGGLASKPQEQEASFVGNGSDIASGIKDDDVAEMRRLIGAQRWRRTAPANAQKNPPALFVLSPPRSGSTLLRVMLGGHGGMFAPPELELLSFDDLRQRREAFSGRHSFWRQGTAQALMRLRGCDMPAAERELEAYEDAGMSTQRFYGLLQEALGDRILVDKTPSYSTDLLTLQRAEEEFEGARYLHLARNPYAMIHSYEEAHLDQIFPRFSHGFNCRAVAELIWLISEQNILEFLSRIPAERQHYLKFENLLSEPEKEMRQVCQWLGLDYEAEMLEPYKEKHRRMTDGVHEAGKMLGDIKFHAHNGIEPVVAERWRENYVEKFVSEQTWELAERLGYERRRWDIHAANGAGHINGIVEARQEDAAFAPILPVGGNHEVDKAVAQVNQLSDEEVRAMLAELMGGQAL